MGIGLALVSWCVKGTAIWQPRSRSWLACSPSIYVPRGRPRRTRLILWTCVYPVRLLSAGSSASSCFRPTSTRRSSIAIPGRPHLANAPARTATPSCCSTRNTTARSSIPATHFSNSSNSEIHPDGPDAVSGVRVIQVAGNKILGGAGPIGQYSSPAARNRVDSYFLLDTEAHTRANFDTYDALTQPHRKRLALSHTSNRCTASTNAIAITWFDLSRSSCFSYPSSEWDFFLARRVSRLRKSAAPADRGSRAALRELASASSHFHTSAKKNGPGEISRAVSSNANRCLRRLKSSKVTASNKARSRART